MAKVIVQFEKLGRLLLCICEKIANSRPVSCKKHPKNTNLSMKGGNKYGSEKDRLIPKRAEKGKTAYPGTACRAVWSNKPQRVEVGDWQQHAGSQYSGGTGGFL